MSVNGAEPAEDSHMIAVKHSSGRLEGTLRFSAQ